MVVNISTILADITQPIVTIRYFLFDSALSNRKYLMVTIGCVMSARIVEIFTTKTRELLLAVFLFGKRRFYFAVEILNRNLVYGRFRQVF